MPNDPKSSMSGAGPAGSDSATRSQNMAIINQALQTAQRQQDIQQSRQGDHGYYHYLPDPEVVL